MRCRLCRVHSPIETFINVLLSTKILPYEGFDRPFPSSPVPLSQNESKCKLSYENELQFYSHANQSHFHKNGVALGLALKQRHKGTRKWSINSLSAFTENQYSVHCDQSLLVSSNAP